MFFFLYKARNVNTNDQGTEDAKKALNLIWNMIRYDPSERKSMWEVMDSDYFQLEPSNYQIYDVPDKKPGLCVIVCQETFHDVSKSRNIEKNSNLFILIIYSVLKSLKMIWKEWARIAPS